MRVKTLKVVTILNW